MQAPSGSSAIPRLSDSRLWSRNGLLGNYAGRGPRGTSLLRTPFCRKQNAGRRTVGLGNDPDLGAAFQTMQRKDAPALANGAVIVVFACNGHDAPAAGEVSPQIIARPRPCRLHGTQCGWSCQDAAWLEECARHRCAVGERGPVGVQMSFLAFWGYSVGLILLAGGSEKAACKRHTSTQRRECRTYYDKRANLNLSFLGKVCLPIRPNRHGRDIMPGKGGFTH